MSAARVCIVSSGCLSSGPRVEKEADALTRAGYRVHVLVLHTLPWMRAWDARLAADKTWSYEAISFPNAGIAKLPRSVSRAVTESARFLTRRVGYAPVLAELALSETVLPLMLGGLALRADLFIAHNLAALPLASMLARMRGARLAFDAEDDHLGEHGLEQPSGEKADVIDALQTRYLPGCDYVTAASRGIADVLADRYRIRLPTVIHNVFPWALRATLDGQRRERGSAPLSLVWYSQTIGLDRGLQDTLEAVGKLRGDCELHLRGSVSEPVRAELMHLAQRLGIATRVSIRPQIHPAELLSRIAEHDVGLAVEQPVNRNKLNTVSNKLFFYMLAGLGLAATSTPGQQLIMDSVPDAGFSYAPGNVDALAAGLQRWLDHPELLVHARAHSLAAARDHYNAELEYLKLLSCVESALAARSPRT